MSQPPEPHGTRRGRGRGRGRGATRGSPSPSNQLRGNTQSTSDEPQEACFSERRPSGNRDRKRPEVQVYVPRARRLQVEENNVENHDFQSEGRVAQVDSSHSNEKQQQKNEAGVSPRQDRKTRAGRRPRPEIQRYVPRALRQGIRASELSQESWDERHTTISEARSKLADSPKSSSFKKLKSGMENHCQEEMKQREINTSELGSGVTERTSHNSSERLNDVSSESMGASNLVHNFKPGVDNVVSDTFSVDHKEGSSESKNFDHNGRTSSSVSDTCECLSESTKKVLESPTDGDPGAEASESVSSQKDSDQQEKFVSTGKDDSMECTQKEVPVDEKRDLIFDVPQATTLCGINISETQTKARVFETDTMSGSSDSCPQISEKLEPASDEARQVDVSSEDPEHQFVDKQGGSADGSQSSEVSQNVSNSADSAAMEVDSIHSLQVQESCNLGMTKDDDQKLQSALVDSNLSVDRQASKTIDDSHSIMQSPVPDSSSVSDSAVDEKADQLKQEASDDVQQSVSEDLHHSMEVSEASTDSQVTAQRDDENDSSRELEKQLKAQAIAAMTFEDGGSRDGEDQEEEEDSWDKMFDDNGDCLDPSLMKELTAQVGKVQIDKPKINYLAFQPKEPDIDMDSYGHVIEIYDFPSEFLTRDLIAAFKDFMSRGFDIKWVDDTHALGVFASTIAAQDALHLNHPLLKVRSLSEASRQSKMKAKRNCEFLQPYKPRPETSALAARRLVSGALGLQAQIPKEKREQERKQLKEAKEKRRKDRKLKQDMWDGSVGRCAMDQE